MAILNFNAAPQASNRSPFAGLQTPSNERPKAKLWLNIGYDINGKFINLPVGLPIDTMEAADVRGQNEDWIKQRTAQNELLKALQAHGAALAPGQEEIVTLTVKLRRVNEQMEIPAGTNEYAADLSSLFVKPQVNVAAE